MVTVVQNGEGRAVNRHRHLSRQDDDELAYDLALPPERPTRGNVDDGEELPDMVEFAYREAREELEPRIDRSGPASLSST